MSEVRLSSVCFDWNVIGPAETPGGERVSWEIRHSVVAGTSQRLAWQYWTDVANWRQHEGAAAESIVLHGPFQTGTRGTTKLPGAAPRTWRLVEVSRPDRAVIEMNLDGAVLHFTWTFEALGDSRARLTQHITLEGPSAGQYRSEIEALFTPNIGPGMEKLARDMSHADGTG